MSAGGAVGRCAMCQSANADGLILTSELCPHCGDALTPHLDRGSIETTSLHADTPSHAIDFYEDGVQLAVAVLHDGELRAQGEGDNDLCAALWHHWKQLCFQQLEVARLFS